MKRSQWITVILLMLAVFATRSTLNTYPMIDSTCNAEVIEINGVTYKSRPDTLGASMVVN
jgi:hypothetical protein